MQIIKVYRNGDVKEVLEVTKKDLFDLKQKHPYISISEADLKNVSEYSDNEVVGIIAGEVSFIGNENEKTPDCWFVFNPEKHGYKKLDENFKCDFGDAIRLLKKGLKVARKGWNGKNMWLIYVPGSFCSECRKGSPYEKAGLESVEINGHIDLYTTQGTIQPGWLASQADMLAEDWIVVK